MEGVRFLGPGMIALALTGAAAGDHPDLIQQSFSRLYNFDFAGAHRALDLRLREDSSDPLAQMTRAAAHLFSELHRLGILESQFLTDDRRITEKKKAAPDLRIKQQMMEAVSEAQRCARARLARDPNDANALFALALSSGILADYASLVEKRHFAALSHARQSQAWAVKLLAADPRFYDAYLTAGISEYLAGSLPFFVRWFVPFEQTRGDKGQAVRNLEVAARSGRYMGPFARILLAIIHLRENHPAESEKLLAGLARDYPENPLIRNELARLRARPRGQPH